MKFSVVIPAYNAQNFIERSVNSVLSQTYDDFEIVVVNDGSTDKTLDCLYRINSPKLSIINQQNSGVSAARNNGILNSEGDYICFLDADDEYFVNHLERLNILIEKYPDKEFYCTRFCLQLLDGKTISPNCLENDRYLNNAVEAILKEPELVWTGCVCVKKDVFHKYGFFEVGVKIAEDTDMWKRIYVHAGVVLYDSVTVKRNRDGSEATKNYIRSHEVDKLNRFDDFMSDDSISKEVKNSLTIERELSKIEVIRTHLIEGNKRKALQLLKDVKKGVVPRKKIIVTKICFLVPSGLLRVAIKRKYSNMYKW